ncbi:MAG: ABC transporter C-terminal domain-containing protein, partial [Chloroflexales bacterium]|nr:ABC transporter C-terminal domain-containing protein [Chloroflexales bacterium]
MSIDRTQQIAQLQTEIAGLEQAINALAALPQEQQRLQAQLTEKRRQLAALQSNAALPGVTQIQRGGVNFGVDGTFGDITIGDVVGG